jgi:hypothetical protein
VVQVLALFLAAFLPLVRRPPVPVPGRESGPRRAPVQQGLDGLGVRRVLRRLRVQRGRRGLRGQRGGRVPAPRGGDPDQLGEQVRGARGALIGELPLRDDGPAPGAGIEGAAPEAPGRVERRDLRVGIGETLQITGRVEQGHDAARDVQRRGARNVKPPPGPGLQELCHESRLSHEE